jgi:hypothetical protein
LLTNLNQPTPGGIRYCDGVISTSDDRRTGVDRLIREFAQLSLFGNLAGTPGRDPLTIVDVLRYTPSTGHSDMLTVTVALAISTAKTGERGPGALGKRVTGGTPSALRAIDQFKTRPAQTP